MQKFLKSIVNSEHSFGKCAKSTQKCVEVQLQFSANSDICNTSCAKMYDNETLKRQMCAELQCSIGQ